MPRKADEIDVNPKLYMQRYLHYQERHSAWHIFRSVYWAIFLVAEGALLLYYNSLHFTVQIFFGITMFILALMVVVYGFTMSLHLKLMKRYG